MSSRANQPGTGLTHEGRKVEMGRLPALRLADGYIPHPDDPLWDAFTDCYAAVCEEGCDQGDIALLVSLSKQLLVAQIVSKLEIGADPWSRPEEH